MLNLTNVAGNKTIRLLTECTVLVFQYVDESGVD